MKEIVEMICRGTPRLFRSVKVSRESQIIVYKILQLQPSKRPTSKLLLLNPRLVPYVARVYLNLGRAYAAGPDNFGTHIFEQFVPKPCSEKNETKNWFVYSFFYFCIHFFSQFVTDDVKTIYFLYNARKYTIGT